MRRHRVCAFLSLALVASLAVPGSLLAESSTWTLKSAVKQLDETSSDFRSAVAEVEVESLDSAGAEPTTSSGKAYFDRGGSVRFDLTDPSSRTVLSTGSQLYVYDPNRAIVELYPVEKHPERVEPYATIGFSESGSTLEKSYVVTLLGEKSLDGRQTLMLELTPKSDKTRAQVSRIQVWIEEGSWLPLQQTVFHGAEGAYTTTKYRNAARNVPVDDSMFKPKWPKGTQTVKR